LKRREGGKKRESFRGKKRGGDFPAPRCEKREKENRSASSPKKGGGRVLAPEFFKMRQWSKGRKGEGGGEKGNIQEFISFGREKEQALGKREKKRKRKQGSCPFSSTKRHRKEKREGGEGGPRGPLSTITSGEKKEREERDPLALAGRPGGKEERGRASPTQRNGEKKKKKGKKKKGGKNKDLFAAIYIQF